MPAEIQKLQIPSSQIKSFLQCDDERACALAALFNKVFPKYQINTLPRVHMSLAQMAHESDGFNTYTENLNYSASGLAKTWPTRFAVNPHAEVKIPNKVANQIARQPELIANAAYGGRMGNDQPDDGWNFRGSGAIQLTGKDTAKEYAKYKGFSDPYDTLRLCRESDEYAIDSACWEMVVSKGLLDEMDRGHLEHTTERINGGLIGLASRKRLFDRAKKFITTI